MSSRREFLKNTSTIGFGLVTIPNIALGVPIANTKEKINMGIIGVGLRGTAHLKNLLLRDDVNITAICDIDNERLKIAEKIISEAGAVRPKLFGKDASWN